ncbi:hypothetical protein [Actinosynnema mirum]|uniref:Uncharacterized protein n=1 Tax=Actinosynnema mirum (strain ATCC 29888 / DSM 43827 / JCM 3225 / NBRC 14064 / NCIMB 13271 / NRRL B-12336 / IMRU 3971 / 101) TaxID=446462 RepID=C6WHM3_ACTMD|nr:hypothetical protein [Actinosynnema mirum]ACU39972.1 hypothetical protein Amir_6165 [Actinosynnema mirum DSM 43827]
MTSALDEPLLHNTNTAQDNARVDQQIGFQIGDTTIHHDKRTYHVNHGDPPERRHEVARNFLDGGTPRRAEDLLGALVADGWGTAERAYLHALAILSERSLGELSGEPLERLKEARNLRRKCPEDGWTRAFDVLWALLRWARDDYRTPATAAVADLPLERQEEISRHLDVLLRGAAQEWRAADLRAHLAAERTDPARAARSEKFFEAVPAPPRPHVPAVFSGVPAHRLWALLGAAGTAGSLLLADLPPLAHPLLLAGGFLVVRNGITVEADRLLRASDRATGEPARNTKFARRVGNLVDRLYAEAGPERGTPAAQHWARSTKRARTRLRNRLARSHHGGVEPASLRWLVRWHAERERDGRHPDDRHPDRPDPSRARLLRLTGALLALLGLVTAPHAALPLALAGSLLLAAVTRLAAPHAANRAVRAEADALHAEELAEHQRWSAHLADRPTDAQVARWHALDRFHLVSDVINRFGLRRDQVVQHVVLTECAPGARRGRLENGPPRYSAYLVRILLLTRKGVRLIRLHLDAHTGEARNEERFLFRYDAVVSAKVTEKGVRATAADDEERTDVEDLRSRVFTLVLSNNESIAVRVDASASGEDPEALVEAAYETSGIENALPLLESIAAEGEDWIEHERERRRQWTRDWDED